MPPQLPFINDSCLIPLITKLGYFFFNVINRHTIFGRVIRQAFSLTCSVFTFYSTHRLLKAFVCLSQPFFTCYMSSILTQIFIKRSRLSVPFNSIIVSFLRMGISRRIGLLLFLFITSRANCASSFM